MTKEVASAVRRALQDSKAVATSCGNERQANLAYLGLVIDAVRPLMANLVGSVHQEVDRIALSLYMTLFQLAESVRLLASHGPSIAIPTLTRQALDGYVDLCNVLKQENYWKRLQLADDQSWQKALQVASAAKNPFMKLISESGDTLIDGRRLHAERIAEWKRQGITEADAKERFKIAEMSNEYESVWPMLSAYLHNSVSLLMSRHFNISEDEPLQIDMRPKQFPYELSCTAHIGELLLMAAEKIHERFGSERIDLSAVHRATKELTDRVAGA